MKAKKVNEAIDFKRGEKPYKALDIGAKTPYLTTDRGSLGIVVPKGFRGLSEEREAELLPWDEDKDISSDNLSVIWDIDWNTDDIPLHIYQGLENWVTYNFDDLYSKFLMNESIDFKRGQEPYDALGVGVKKPYVVYNGYEDNNEYCEIIIPAGNIIDGVKVKSDVIFYGVTILMNDGRHTYKELDDIEDNYVDNQEIWGDTYVEDISTLQDWVYDNFDYLDIVDKVNESNLNPYDKIGVMMAQEMGTDLAWEKTKDGLGVKQKDVSKVKRNRKRKKVFDKAKASDDIKDIKESFKRNEKPYKALDVGKESPYLVKINDNTDWVVFPKRTKIESFELPEEVVGTVYYYDESDAPNDAMIGEVNWIDWNLTPGAMGVTRYSDLEWWTMHNLDKFARKVNESISFKRGQEPYDALDVGEYVKPAYTLASTSWFYEEILATPNQLKKILGEPYYEDPTDPEGVYIWSVRFRDNALFTVYDRDKPAHDPDTKYRFHIGGFNKQTTIRGREFIEKRLKMTESVSFKRGDKPYDALQVGKNRPKDKIKLRDEIWEFAYNHLIDNAPKDQEEFEDNGYFYYKLLEEIIEEEWDTYPVADEIEGIIYAALGAYSDYLNDVY